MRPRRLSLVLAAALGIAALAGCRGGGEASPRTDGGPVAASAVSASASSAAGPEPGVDRFSERGMLAEASLYIDNAEFRRSSLVAALSNPKNTYSRQRLDSYGLSTKGWDLLPEWTPQSVPVTVAMAADLRAKRPLTLDPATPRLWNGKRPTTMAEWVALGREVFLGYPLRVEVFMNYALEHPEVGERVGIRAGADGVYPGVRLFTTLEGTTALGITCAVCHTSVDARGAVTIGEARRAFDYGALRLAYHRDTGVRIDPELARRMRTWGPGRADVTEDDDEDPVAIPDLWGLRHQAALTQAGTIKHAGPVALAIRQETQLMQSNHHKVRPPRELSYALAMFLYSLVPPPAAASPASQASPASPAAAAAPASARVTHGRELFTQKCKSCHSNEAYGGPPVEAARVGTDRALAFGGARGTGHYRPPALLRVAAAAPYFHHGAVPTLEDVLSPARLEPTYAGSPVGKGAVPGHAFGTDLPSEDRAALVAFLRTL